MLHVKGPLYLFARTDRNKDTNSTNHQLCDVSSRYIAHALSTESVTKAWLHRRIRNQTRLACCSIDVPPHPMPELLRALQKQLDEDGVELHCFSAGPTDDERELIDSEWCETENEIIYDDVREDVLDLVQVRTRPAAGDGLGDAAEGVCQSVPDKASRNRATCTT